MGEAIDPEAVVRAVRSAIPTSRHAQMFYDAVAVGLGGGGAEDTANDGTVRNLHRPAKGGAPGMVPWPLLRLCTTGRLGVVVPLTGPAVDPPPRPGRPPKLRNLGPAEIELHDGPQRLTVTYGEDGRGFEASRSRDLSFFLPVLRALAEGGAAAPEILADAVLAADPGRHGPARVDYPSPIPGGVSRAYRQGLWAVRRSLFESAFPFEGGVAVADGFAGSVLTWGRTRKEALDAWRVGVEASSPRPPESRPLPEPPPEPKAVEDGGEIPGEEAAPRVIRGPTPDAPWPAFAPANTPAIVIPVDAARTEDSPYGSWIRLLDRFGRTYPALLRQDPAGFTLVGDQVADRLDLAQLEDRLAEAPPPDRPPLAGRPEYDCHRLSYRLFDDETREPVRARIAEAASGWSFDPGVLDGADLRWRVLRQRWGDAP